MSPIFDASLTATFILGVFVIFVLLFKYSDELLNVLSDGMQWLEENIVMILGGFFLLALLVTLVSGLAGA